jgi:hypothetical protein
MSGNHRAMKLICDPGVTPTPVPAVGFDPMESVVFITLEATSRFHLVAFDSPDQWCSRRFDCLPRSQSSFRGQDYALSGIGVLPVLLSTLKSAMKNVGVTKVCLVLRNQYPGQPPPVSRTFAILYL